MEAVVHVKLVAVGLPMVPKAFPFAVGCRHEAMVHGCICNIAIMAETVLEFKWNIRQEVFCRGNCVLKEVRKSKGVIGAVVPSPVCWLNLRLAKSA